VAPRAGLPLIWNATNLSRSRRAGIIDLCADYQATVQIVYCEAGEAECRRRNRARERPVPERAIARMIARWETPDLTECHELELMLS
jgi:predicted kinase